MSKHRGHSVSQHDFSKAPQALIPRTKFNRSHGHKTTFDAGYLIPVFVDEALPGDTFNLRMTAFARVATLLFPIMDSLVMDVHFFFCPTRLVWEHWEQFNGANIPNTSSSTDYLVPQLASTATGYATSSLFDYMGLPTLVTGTALPLQPSALPMRCFNQIYNDWYRDENYNDMIPVAVDDGPDPLANYVLRHRNKRYDYFTSCLPFPQKGPAVTIPLIGDAPVVPTATNNYPTFTNSTGSVTPDTLDFHVGTDVTAFGYFAGTVSSSPIQAYWGSQTGLETDLSGVAATTINALRLAATTQQMYEQDARGGTRYTEIIRSHFGIISPDARLQRAEILSVHSKHLNIHSVPQTSATGITGSDYPQANLAAFGTLVINDAGFTYSFQEHGYVIGIVSVRSHYTYWQGAERFWFRSARFDFFWPTFAHIGEMAVLNQEIYATGTATDVEVFGYQGAFDDYRYKPARLSGFFRSNATGGSLDAWHLAQDFGALPTLGSTFIAESPPMSRIEAVTDAADFIFDSHFDYTCVRPMPMYAVPGIRRL